MLKSGTTAQLLIMPIYQSGGVNPNTQQVNHTHTRSHTHTRRAINQNLKAYIMCNIRMCHHVYKVTGQNPTLIFAIHDFLHNHVSPSPCMGILSILRVGVILKVTRQLFLNIEIDACAAVRKHAAWHAHAHAVNFSFCLLSLKRLKCGVFCVCVRVCVSLLFRSSRK